MLYYPGEPSDRFRKTKQTKKNCLTIQHILELLGLIQTNKRLNIIYKWKKIQFVMRGKTDKNTYKYIIYILKKWILSIVDLFIQPMADVQCSRANDLRHGNLLYCRLHFFFLSSSSFLYIFKTISSFLLLFKKFF